MEDRLPYTVTSTQAPALDVLDILPDDERRLILAWRQAQSECRNGQALVTAAKVNGKMLLWIGHGAGMVMLR